jgi:protein phosphatase 2C family protein 2/3
VSSFASSIMYSLSVFCRNVCHNQVTSRYERSRIESLGLKSEIRKGRLFGVLAVSRSFGDIALKTRQNSSGGAAAVGGGSGKSSGLSSSPSPSSSSPSSASSSGDGGGALVATPEVLKVRVEPLDEFVLVASDGVWDVLGSKRAVNFVRKRLVAHHCAQRAAGELVSEALALGGHDNTSALVIMLHQCA